MSEPYHRKFHGEDRNREEYPRDWCWWNEGHDCQGSLPRRVFNRLKGGRLANLGDFRVYPTREEAIEAYEDALEEFQ